jgi:trigger factor
MKFNMQKKWIAVLLCGSVLLAGCGSSTGSVNGIRSYDVDKYVTLGDYKNLEVEVAGDYEVTEDEIIDNINDMMTYYPSYEDTDKQTVEDGDFVNIDYEGKKDGVAFDGGTAQGYVLEIGSDSFIDGFEDGLIGVSVGDTVDLNLTFPENYSEELGGADVVFTVTVNKIVNKQVLTYEELTDDYVSSNMSYDSVAALYDDMKSYMESNNEQDRTVAARSAVLDKLIENSKIAVPDGLLDMKVDQYIQQFTNQNCSDGTTLADFLDSTYGMTEDDFRSTVTTQMEENLDDELVLEALANAEGTTVDEDGFAEYVSSSMTSGSYDTEDDLYAAFDSDYEDGKTYLEHRYLLTSALTNLLDQCSITYTGEDTDAE